MREEGNSYMHGYGQYDGHTHPLIFLKIASLSDKFSLRLGGTHFSEEGATLRDKEMQSAGEETGKLLPIGSLVRESSAGHSRLS